MKVKDKNERTDERKKKSSKAFEEKKSKQGTLWAQWGTRGKRSQDERTVNSWVGWSWVHFWHGLVNSFLSWLLRVFLLFIWTRVGRPTLMRCHHHHLRSETNGIAGTQNQRRNFCSILPIWHGREVVDRFHGVLLLSSTRHWPLVGRENTSWTASWWTHSKDR